MAFTKAKNWPCVMSRKREEEREKAGPFVYIKAFGYAFVKCEREHPRGRAFGSPMEKVEHGLRENQES